jgi:D-serine deaminase-like pyridoxal phosphate-dependent protein
MDIKRPTAVIWKNRVKNNIKIMNDKVINSKAILRPHFKTHHNIEIGNWFKEEKITQITVSSVEMAKFFADNGWKDITIAFPINILEIDEINKINSEIENLQLLVESFETIEFLENKLQSICKIWIKIDIGYGRTGIDFNDKELILSLVEKIVKFSKLKFEGLLTHAGHSYRYKDKQSKINIYNDSIANLQKLKEFLEEKGFNTKLSYGDTPTCSIIDNFTGFHEIRPGNFALYDLTQLEQKNCNEDNIALAIACPIVAKHQNRNEIVIYGGGVHFSKDSIKYADGTAFYGYVVEKNSDGTWKQINTKNYLKSISQEHGVLKLEPASFNSLKVGEIVYILPIHSCMTMDLLKNHIKIIET